MKPPLVSVVIPTYNSRRLLESALAGVWAQTFQDFEVIVVDDGSTDATQAWLAGQRDPRLRVVAQSNQGAAAARNAGARAARGEYLAFLDADDLWLPDKLERQMGLFGGPVQPSFVFSDGYWFQGDAPYDEVLAAPKMRLSDRCARIPSWLTLDQEFRLHLAATSSTVVPARVFEQVSGFPPLRQGEDFVFCCKALAHGPARSAPEPLMVYRAHASNTSSHLRSRRATWSTIRAKDVQCVEAARALNGSTASRAIRLYPKLPMPVRFVLLLVWQARYRDNKWQLTKDLARYAFHLVHESTP
jgi:glycosyltransferase involved in cell wall biosynthesis